MWIAIQDKLINLDHVSSVTRTGKVVNLIYGYFGVNKSQDLMSGVIDNSTLASDTIKCETEEMAQTIFNGILGQVKPVNISLK